MHHQEASLPQEAAQPLLGSPRKYLEAIARGLLCRTKRSPLDEATGVLDSVAEQLAQEAFAYKLSPTLGPDFNWVSGKVSCSRLDFEGC